MYKFLQTKLWVVLAYIYWIEILYITIKDGKFHCMCQIPKNYC